MMNFQKLGNTRESAANNNPEVAVATTEGVIKLTVPIQTRIGATIGTYVGVAKDPETDTFYLYIGSKDDKNQDGNKLISAAGKNGGTLQFSSKSSWKAMGGDGEQTFVYDVATEPVENDGTEYWALEHVATREKQERLASAEA